MPTMPRLGQGRSGNGAARHRQETVEEVERLGEELIARSTYNGRMEILQPLMTLLILAILTSLVLGYLRDHLVVMSVALLLITITYVATTLNLKRSLEDIKKRYPKN